MPKRDATDLKDAIEDAKEKRRELKEREYLAALGRLLETPDGRVVWLGILDQASVFRSIWDPSAKIHYNAGQQDFGQALMGHALAANEQAYITLVTEGKKRALEEERIAEKEEEQIRREFE